MRGQDLLRVSAITREDDILNLEEPHGPVVFAGRHVAVVERVARKDPPALVPHSPRC